MELMNFHLSNALLQWSLALDLTIHLRGVDQAAHNNSLLSSLPLLPNGKGPNNLSATKKRGSPRRSSSSPGRNPAAGIQTVGSKFGTNSGFKEGLKEE